ncbi:MAG: ABC transporter permease subunit [Clostridiales bacterium]|nr:ABC transporter permease subunit [Candidatus Blautia equi]
MEKPSSLQMLWLKKVGAIFLALTFWQIAAMKIHSRILLVTPIAVLKRLCTIWQVENFFSSIWFTFYHIAGGFLLGLILGILLAFLAHKIPVLEILFWPWMVTIKSVPVASFIVICLVWLSVNNLSIFISFLIVLPVIYQNILTGLKSGNREMKEMAQIFRVSPFRKLKYIIIPHLRPYLLSACTVTAGMAWKAGVAAEIIGTPSGSMGKMLFLAKTYLATDDLLAWTVIIVAISVISEKVFLYVLKKLLGESKRRDAA